MSSLGKRESLAPWPYVAQTRRHDVRFPREHHVGGRHLRRHDADEIVRPEDAIDQPDERLAGVPAPLDRDVEDVEKEHEDPVPGIGGGLLHGADAVRLRSQRLRVRPGS